MITPTFIILLILSIDNGDLTPIIEYDKGVRYEEYIVEHEVTAGQARNAVLTLDTNFGKPPPGCQTCTKDEINYCLGPDLINDHCCCDMRYHEYLPFVPHTCYKGPKLCRPIIGNCAEYSRLRACCCEQPVIEKWRRRSGAITATVNYIFLPLIVLLNVFFI